MLEKDFLKSVIYNRNSYVYIWYLVASWQGWSGKSQGNSRSGKSQGILEFSGKFGILLKVREIQEKSGKFKKIYIS